MSSDDDGGRGGKRCYKYWCSSATQNHPKLLLPCMVVGWGGWGAITSGWGKVPAPLEDRPKVPAPARPPAVHENLLALSDGAVDAANAARSEEVASLQAH